MGDSIVVYRSEYERAVDQLMFRDGGALVILLVLGAALAILFLYFQWEKWHMRRQARKKLLDDDYDSRPYRGSSLTRTRGSRMRGSSYGAQHDGSYVYVAPHDLHSHGSDYCSDSCDSGGSDSGGCDGGGDGGGCD